MNEKFKAIDIRRSYEVVFEGQQKTLEVEYCITHTYTFQVDEGCRYIFLADEFEYIDLIGLKFYRAEDYERKDRYNVLVGLKNPFRFFSTLLHIIKNHVAVKFPNHSFILKGEPTLLEIGKGKDYEVNTKRFAFYKRLLAEFVYSGSYSFEEIKEKNIFPLVKTFTNY